LIGCDRIGPPETETETDPGIMQRSGPLTPAGRIFYTWHFLPADIARVIVGEYGRCTKAVSRYTPPDSYTRPDGTG